MNEIQSNLGIEAFEGELRRFFQQTKMTATYKPILFKSLIYYLKKQDFQRHNHTIIIPISKIIQYFFKFNYALLKRYCLKQLNNPNEEVAIYRIINKFYAEKDELKLSEDINSNALRETRKLLFRNPIFRLRNEVHLYDFFTESKKKIHLNDTIKDEKDFRANIHNVNSKPKDLFYIGVPPHVYDFVIINYPILERALLALLIQFLEQHNNSPNLSQKLMVAMEEYDYLRNISDGERRRLFEYQEYKCFYCKREVGKEEGMHADHFVPYSYLFDSQIWNIVGACPQCNSDKSNYVVQEVYIEKILNRNANPTFNSQFFIPREQNTNSVQAINTLLKNLYNNCRMYFKYKEI